MTMAWIKRAGSAMKTTETETETEDPETKTETETQRTTTYVMQSEAMGVEVL